MKRSFLKFCLFICIPLLSVTCSGKEKLSGKEFLVEGEISGIEDGTVIQLFRWDGGVGYSIASDTLKNGRFIFKKKAIFSPERLTISPKGNDFPSMFLYVWVAPGVNVKIRGKGKIFPLWKVKSSIPNQKEENRFTDKNCDIIAESARISAERSNVFSKIMTASSEDEARPYSKIVDSLDVIGDSLSLIEIFANVNIMEKTNISPIWLDKMRVLAWKVKPANEGKEYYSELRKKAEALYDRMSEEDKTTLVGYNITADLFPPPVVGVGDNMTDADFLDIYGNTKHLSDYSGKYLLLDFWSRGCGPCIMALPEMKEVSEIYRDKLTIISISLDTDAVWKEAMNANDMPWVNIRDPKSYGGLAANYGTKGIPNYVVISPEGKIIDKWGGFGSGLIKKKVSENIK